MKLATATGQAALDPVKALLNGGTLVMYSGTQPANPDTALSGNTALATWTFSATAFGSDSLSGSTEQASASFVASTVTPTANGTATFARCLKSDGTTVVCDLTVGTSATDIVIGNTALVTTNPVGPLTLTLGEPVH